MANSRVDGCLQRFEEKPNMWLGSLRADGGRPHLVPIWYVVHGGKLWVASLHSQKVRNVAADERVIAALDDTMNPCVLEATARIEPVDTIRDELAPLFQRKYDWDFRHDTDGDYVLISLTPTRALLG